MELVRGGAIGILAVVLAACATASSPAASSNGPVEAGSGMPDPATPAATAVDPTPAKTSFPLRTPPPTTLPVTPEPTSSPEAFPPGSLMATIVDDVRVRSQPGIADPSIRYEPLLRLGTEFEIIRGPELADGYRWYLVRLTPGILHGGVTTGWVAAGSRGGEPWIEPRGIDQG